MVAALKLNCINDTHDACDIYVFMQGQDRREQGQRRAREGKVDRGTFQLSPYTHAASCRAFDELHEKYT